MQPLVSNLMLLAVLAFSSETVLAKNNGAFPESPPACWNIEAKRGGGSEFPILPFQAPPGQVFYRLANNEHYKLSGWILENSQEQLILKVSLTAHPELGTRNAKTLADSPEYPLQGSSRVLNYFREKALGKYVSLQVRSKVSLVYYPCTQTVSEVISLFVKEFSYENMLCPKGVMIPPDFEGWNLKTELE